MNFASITKRLLNLSWRLRRSRHHLRLGARGERLAARYLKRRHHRIIARNFRCPVGEIDLVSLHGDTLVFVEVKTRSTEEAEDLRDAVRRGKWARVERAARYFLMHRLAANRPCRFDLVTVVWPPQGRPQVEHFEDAFQPRRG